MKDKVVVITGASAGIGASLAEEVSRRGARPVLVARRGDLLDTVAAQCGSSAVPMVADVTRRPEIQQVVDGALGRFGRIDVWVNNAGKGISRPVSQLTDEDLDEMLLVNLKSALWCMQAVLPQMKSRGTGHIINVSTMLSRLPLAHFRSAYGAAKAALNSLTASLRMELAQQFPNIQVSTYLPGVVATDFGLNARGGGVDSRALPFAQPAAEVAASIADLIEHPRAEAYSRPIYRQQQAEYYGAEDVGELERKPPYTR
jgi:NAD(P)-dependent dehydrogenase (short-subunit alcohol dehydrogenase family)